MSIFGIDLLVFPGHCSHLLQPFDVSVASPLKVEFKKALLNYDFVFDENGFIKRRTKKTNQELRQMILSCLIEAVEKSCTTHNISAGFSLAGLAPLDPEAPLKSEFAMDNKDNQSIYKIKENIVNNQYLNKEKEAISKLFQSEKGREPIDNELDASITDLRILVGSLHKSSVSDGKLLSTIPDFLIENDDGITRYSLET